MSQSQVFNNTTYSIPVQGDPAPWGPSLTRYLAALGTYTFSPAGGTRTLTADLNLGASFGLLAPYYKSVSANISSTGVIRLAHGDAFGWRNNANSGDLMFGVNSSDQLLFNGAPFFSGALTNGHILVGSASNIATDVALSGDVAITNAGVASVNNVQAGVITNAMVNNAAAIAYSKLSLTGSIVNSDINSSAAIAYSKLALTGSILNADISASAAIAVSKLASLGGSTNAVVTQNSSGNIQASSILSSNLFLADGTVPMAGQLLAHITNSAAAPDYSWSGDPDTGLFRSAANSFDLVAGGTSLATVGVTGISTTQPVQVSNGTNSLPSLTFASDTDTGFYHTSANEIGVACGGTNQYKFNTAAFFPVVDNSFSCGASGVRWSTVWAANGTIQTSMSDTKTNVREMQPEECKIPKAAFFTRPGEPTSSLQLGFLADNLPPEAHPVINQATGERSQTDVYTHSVIAMLCQAARNDHDRIQALEARIAALEAKLPK